MENLVGQIFDRLTVLNFSHKENGISYWLCRCICTKEKTIARSSLVRGQTKSCGCYNREINRSRLRDLTNQKFGLLTVISLAPKKGRHTYWLCRCNCGVEKSICASTLIQKTTVSCGCYATSIRRERGKNLHEDEKLRNHSIYYRPTAGVLRKYKLTPEQHYKLWDLYKGLCHSCWFEGIYKPLRIDHDHTTGQVRGLLCNSCNRAEGFIKTKERALALGDYITKYKEGIKTPSEK